MSDAPLVEVTGSAIYGAEPDRLDVRLRVDPSVDALDLQVRLTRLVRALNAQLRDERGEST